MVSLRDELLAGLPPLLEAKAAKLGLSAELADDDIAWILLVSAVRLDLDALNALAESSVREGVGRVIDDFTESAVENVSHRILGLVTSAVEHGSEMVVQRQRRVQTTLQLMLLLAAISALALALWVGANGWTGYLAQDIRDLEAKRSVLQSEQRPEWVGWWGLSPARRPMLFLTGVRQDQLKITSCHLEDVKGLCMIAE